MLHLDCLKFVRYFLCLLLIACATIHKPNEQSAKGIEVQKALHELKTALSDQTSDYEVTVSVTRHRLIQTFKGNNSTEITILNFSELPEITGYTQGGTYRIQLPDEKNYIFIWKDAYRSDSGVAHIADIFYALKKYAIEFKNESEQYTSMFKSSLPTLRQKAASKTALPEEAMRYKIQAEGAVNDKSFNEAVDFYQSALKVAPWWPAGHYNLALVQAEIADYSYAIVEMQRYIDLVPNAPNIRDAQNKIYEWQRLEKKLMDSRT